MKSNTNEEVRNRIESSKTSKTEEQLIERDSLILQANYLSEIERISKENGFNRKDLALKIKTSPSYLTQVFRGDKPLNFLTLAKIKRALNLDFEVTAFVKSDKKEVQINYFDELISGEILIDPHKTFKPDQIPSFPEVELVESSSDVFNELSEKYEKTKSHIRSK